MKFSKVYLTIGVLFLSLCLVSSSSKNNVKPLAFVPAKEIKPADATFKIQSPMWQNRIKQILKSDKEFCNHFKNK